MSKSNKIEIIYNDDYFVAINKPAGLLSHRSQVDSRENIFALQMVRDMIGQYVYLIHRLDKPTQGVLLFAKSPDIASMTSKLFQEGKVRKSYLAVVRGYLKEKGVINHPLTEIKDKFIHGDFKEEGIKKKAVTVYKRLAKVELPIKVDKYPCTRYSLVLLRPKTGRRHQLRRHMKHLFHPVIGDTNYGKTSHNDFFRNKFGCHQLMLCSIQLKFLHPVTRETIEISSKLNEGFTRILKEFNWNNSRLSYSG